MVQAQNKEHFLVVGAILDHLAQVLMLCLLLDVPVHGEAIPLPNAGQHHSGLLQAIQLGGHTAQSAVSATGVSDETVWGQVQSHLPV